MFNSLMVTLILELVAIVLSIVSCTELLEKAIYKRFIQLSYKIYYALSILYIIYFISHLEICNFDNPCATTNLAKWVALFGIINIVMFIELVRRSIKKTCKILITRHKTFTISRVVLKNVLYYGIVLLPVWIVSTCGVGCWVVGTSFEFSSLF